MTRQQVFERLNRVFQDVFDNEALAVGDATTAADVPGWDSLMHIRLMGAVEDEFDMVFDMKDVVSLQNVGEMADIIMAKGH
ncbi:acyl carrier protein [Ruminococcaceae bacterium OttesenSCG-928-O06]|nr:acyl carrier protein [Ruminococcaceae bacterium OttesenSCG-928-O06]